MHAHSTCGLPSTALQQGLGCIRAGRRISAVHTPSPCT